MVSNKIEHPQLERLNLMEKSARMSLSILGIGTAVPPGTLNQEEALIIADRLCCHAPEHRTWLPSMYAGTGIKNRHTCLGRETVEDMISGQNTLKSAFFPTFTAEDRGPTTQERMEIYNRVAPEIAVRSCAQAIANAGIKASEITHLVTISCTGFTAPGFDYAIVTQLGLNRDVERTNVGFMGCHGSFNGMRVAKAYADADPKAVILMCSVELCSVHYHYGWHPQQMVANALFSDGSGALVVRRGNSSSSATGNKSLVANGSLIVDDSASAMTWNIGNNGFVMTLSKKIPEVIKNELGGWMKTWLAKYGKKIEDIGSWCIHPGGPKILESAVGALGVNDSVLWASREILEQYGNMSSSTILFIMKRMFEKPVPGPMVALGFGPGLNIESALFE